MGLPPNPGVAEAAMSVVPGVLALLDRQLADHSFLGGDRPCVADCTLRAGYGFAEFGKIDVPTGYAHVDRWRAAMDARPSMQQL
jgi:glutathione S-transferase